MMSEKTMKRKIISRITINPSKKSKSTANGFKFQSWNKFFFSRKFSKMDELGAYRGQQLEDMMNFIDI